MYRLLFLLFALIVTIQSKAQPPSDVSLTHYRTAISDALVHNDLRSANELLRDTYQKTRDNRTAWAIGESYFKLRDYVNAEQWFGRIVEEGNAPNDQEALLLYVQTLKVAGKYQDALEQLEGISSSSSSINERIKMEKKGIEMAMKAESLSSIFEIGPLDNGVNSLYAEGSPSRYEDQLYFTSGRQAAHVDKSTNSGGLGYSISTVYQARLDQQNNVLQAVPATASFLQGILNVGDIAFSPSGELVYFTSIEVKGAKIVSSKLFFAKRMTDGWHTRKEVSVAGIELMSDPSFYVLGEKTYLFFAAKEGPEATSDLYYAEIDADGNLDKAMPLEAANTAMNEVSPIVHEGILWFASDGHPSIGGYDLQQAQIMADMSLGKIKNAGLGLNSTYDDMGICFFANNTGVMSSNRAGTESVFSPSTCDDLFFFRHIETSIKLQTAVKNSEGHIQPGATITIVEKINKRYVNPITLSTHEAPIEVDLMPNKSYRLIATHPDYVSDTSEFSTVDVEAGQILKGYMTLSEKSMAPEVDRVIKSAVEVKLESVSFGSNSAELSFQAEHDLDELFDLMLGYPEMTVQISAHTDCRGSEKYNFNLSRKRALACKSYLVTKGISSKRIKTKGFGESQLLNKCSDGVNCSEDEHAINRRVTFMILTGPKEIIVSDEKTVLESSSNMTSNDKPVEAIVKTRDSAQITVLNNHQEFGPISKGEKFSGVFKLKNTGGSDLIIELATACTCTELDWPRLPIAPGQEFDIPFNYDSNKKEHIEDGEDPVVIDIIANTKEVVTEAFFTVKYNPQ